MTRERTSFVAAPVYAGLPAWNRFDDGSYRGNIYRGNIVYRGDIVESLYPWTCGRGPVVSGPAPGGMPAWSLKPPATWEWWKRAPGPRRSARCRRRQW